MAIARILAIGFRSDVPPGVRMEQAGYDSLMKTSVSWARWSVRNSFQRPAVYRNGVFIRAYHGMELKIKDCIGGSAWFIVQIQCGSVIKDVAGTRWGYIRGAEDVQVMDCFPIQYPMSHAGPALEASSGVRSGFAAYSANPAQP